MESWIDSEENEVEDEEDKNAEHLDSPDVDDEDSIDFDEKVSKRYIKKDVTRNGYIANNRLVLSGLTNITSRSCRANRRYIVK